MAKKKKKKRLSYRGEDELILHDLEWILNAIMCTLLRKRQGIFERDTEEGHVKTEAEMRIMQSQADSHQRLEETRNRLTTRTFKRKHSPADTLISDLWPSEL